MKKLYEYQMIMKLIISFTLAFLILLPSNSLAINFGSVVKNNVLTLRQGESDEFTILVWNLENSSFPVTLKAKSFPDGWFIKIEPGNFVLNYSLNPQPYEKWEYLLEKNSLIKVFPVKILVRVPENAKLGSYSILLNVVAGNSSGGISFLVERNFILTVHVQEKSKLGLSESFGGNLKNIIKPITSLNNTFAGTNSQNKVLDETKNEISSIVEKLQSLTGMLVALASSKYLFYIIAFVGILVVSLIIYKYA